jgi:hypothetical protein
MRMRRSPLNDILRLAAVGAMLTTGACVGPCWDASWCQARTTSLGCESKALPLTAPRLFHLEYLGSPGERFTVLMSGGMGNEQQDECRVAIYALREPPAVVDVPRPVLDAPAPSVDGEAPLFESVLPPALDGSVVWRAFDYVEAGEVGEDQPLTIVVAPCDDASVWFEIGVVTSCSERRDDSLEVMVEG